MTLFPALQCGRKPPQTPTVVVGVCGNGFGNVFVDIVVRSPDLKEIGSDGGYQKNKERVKNLRFCGKRKDCTRQLTSILKR